MLHQHIGEFFERHDPLPLQQVHSFLQVVQHRALVAVVPKVLQALLENVAFEHLTVHLEQPVEFPALVNRQVPLSAQQQPLLAFDQSALFLSLAEKLRFPHFVDGVIGVVDDVELVVPDFALRRPLLNAQPKRLLHVHAGGLNAFALLGA